MTYQEKEDKDMANTFFKAHAEGEELQKLIHVAGYKHLEQDEYLDADGNHCLGSREGDAYSIRRCTGVDEECLWCATNAEELEA